MKNAITESAVCPRSSDPFYIVTYCIKRVTTSWTDSTLKQKNKTSILHFNIEESGIIGSDQFEFGYGSAKTGQKEKTFAFTNFK